jgi:Tfp pilus assembly protein PilX
VILIGLVVGGLLYIAFPLLIVVGIIALAASRS